MNLAVEPDALIGLCASVPSVLGGACKDYEKPVGLATFRQVCHTLFAASYVC